MMDLIYCYCSASISAEVCSSVEEGASVAILVRPPWWKSVYAYTVYLMLLLLVIYIVIYWYQERNRQKAKRAYNLLEMRKEKVQEHLEADETELKSLTVSTLAKLRKMTDEEFNQLELYPDFDE